MAYRGPSFYSIGAIFACYVAPAIAFVYRAVEAFFRAVILMPVRFDWRSARERCVVAYRKIADLRPVYRESYDSHGLSLDPERMRT